MRELLECLIGISPSGRNPCGDNKFTLDNSNHVLSPYKVGKKNSVLTSETLNFEFSNDEYML